MTEVSVVIPTFNRWPMLAEAVDSVMAQREVDFELIIVDDGSTDETRAQLPGLAEALRARRQIRIVQTENRGPATARNHGVAVAEAPLIAFLDSDDLWRPGKLQLQIEQMRRAPDCVVSQTDEVWLRRGVRVNPGLRHRKRRGDFFVESLRTCLISLSATIIRTNVFRALGGFDEDMQAAEDYDLWLRLTLHYLVEFLPEPLVTRRAGHLGQLSATVPAIDRFRILALLKLLQHSELSGQKRDAVCDALIEKCRIYGNGAARRGNTAKAKVMATLADMGDKAWRRSSDGSLNRAIDMMRPNLAHDHVADGFEFEDRYHELG
jgi:glycosyltransferase involved in cell wall biosynthesis